MNSNNNINNNNSMANNNDKMSTRKIKISFQGTSRDVDLPSPFTLAGLQLAIASTFRTEMPAHSGPDEPAKDSDLSFTYKDPEGDEIVFDKDSELSLALRLCPSSLEIAAALKETAAKKPDPERRLYKIAARNLREYNGVPSMTPDKLIKTLAFLQLNPRRLVRQGLAPKVLLVRMVAEAQKNESPAQPQPQPLGGDESSGGNEDLAKSVASAMELMSVEDDKKEWNDGFVSVEPAAAAASAEAVDSSSSDDADNDNAAAAKKNVLHEAFVAGGIQLRPREVRPLLLALDVRPRRLVKLGYVDGKYLRAMVEAEKKANARNGDGHRQHMARGCGARGGRPGGKPCGRVMMMRRHLHPAAHPPPPPPAHTDEEEDGMFFVPGKCGGGGQGGSRRGPRHGHPHGPRHGHPHGPPLGPPHGHPRHGPHGRHTGGPDEGEGGMPSHRGPRHGPRHGPPHGPPHGHPRHGGREEGEGGVGFHRGPPHGMARSGRQHQHQHQHQPGYYYWG